MKRTWKSLLLACNWILLSVGTSILIILVQPTSPLPAQEPAASTTVETINSPSSETTKVQKLREALQRSSMPEASPEVSEPKKPESPEEPTLSPEEITRQQKLIEADRLYLAGQIPEAQKIYRQVKSLLMRVRCLRRATPTLKAIRKQN